MTKKEIAKFLKKGIDQLRTTPGESEWGQGYDSGWISLANEILARLEMED